MINVSETYKTLVDSDNRYFTSKVEVYFDGAGEAPVIFDNATLIDFNLLEELQATGDTPLGSLSSNEFTMVLHNDQRKFTPANTSSPYYGKLVPNVMVKPYLYLVYTVDEEEIEEEVPLGVFYTGDWVAPGNSIIVTVTCADSMQTWFNKTLPQIPVIKDTTAAEMFALLFEAAGLTAAQYNIDANITQVLSYGWFTGSTFKEALQQLATSFCCSVYLDRLGVVKVVSNFTTSDSVAALQDSNQIIGSEMPQLYQDIYSSVAVSYIVPNIAEQTTLLQLTDITVPLDEMRLERLMFSDGPIAAIEQVIITNGEGILVESITYGAFDCSIVLRNYGAARTVSITILGRTVGLSTSAVVINNESMVAAIGVKELMLSPYLIQERQSALDYAQLVLALVSDPASKVTAETRGNPALELNDTITIVNPSQQMASVEVVASKFMLDYNGALSSTIHGTKRAARNVYDWVYVCPGLYEYVSRR